MSLNITLKIMGPDLAGESKIAEHEGEIDVLAYSWGGSQTGSFHTGGGGGGGKANFQDLSITKPIDTASPNLLASMAKGDHFEKMVLTIRKAGGDSLKYMEYELDKVLVSSISTGASGGEDTITENVTFNFAKFKNIYTPQADVGSGEGDIEFCWDIEANCPA